MQLARLVKWLVWTQSTRSVWQSHCLQRFLAHGQALIPEYSYFPDLLPYDRARTPGKGHRTVCTCVLVLGGAQASTRHRAYKGQQPRLPEALQEQMGILDNSTVPAWGPPSEWPRALHSQRDSLCAVWFWKQVSPGMAHEDGGKVGR
jgi:hypothetical protein